MDQSRGSGFLLWMMIGIIIGIGIGVLIAVALRKSKNKTAEWQATPPQINTPPLRQEPARRISSPRRCPTCNSTYTDESLTYCVSDGSALVPVNDLPPTQAYNENPR